jgi:hypothetical protein
MAFSDANINVDLVPTSAPSELKYIGPVMSGQLRDVAITQLQHILDHFIANTQIVNTAWLKNVLSNPRAGGTVPCKGGRARRLGYTRYHPSPFNRYAYNSVIVYSRHHLQPHQRVVVPRRAPARRNNSAFS